MEDAWKHLNNYINMCKSLEIGMKPKNNFASNIYFCEIVNCSENCVRIKPKSNLLPSVMDIEKMNVQIVLDNGKKIYKAESQQNAAISGRSDRNL